MTALEFPTLDAAVPAVIKPPAVPATLKATVLAQFDAIRPEITALATRYDKVAFDVATSKGLALAKAARLELRNNGRYMLQRTEARIKDEANELKAVVAEQVAGLIQVLLPVEQSVDAQIKAEEDRRAAAKAEAERIAAELLVKHNERLEGIRQFVAKCQEPGMTSERIASGIMQLGTVDLTDPDNARAVELADAHCRALDAMRTLQAQALGREQEAERQEAIRLENERVAAELAQERARIAEEAAALRREAEALAAQKRAQQAAEDAAQKVEFDRAAAEAFAALEEAKQAEALPPQLLESLGNAAAAVVAANAIGRAQEIETAAPQPPPLAELPATMTVSEINRRLGPLLKTDSMALEQAGFKRETRPGSPGIHFRSSDWELMRANFIKHTQGLM